MSEIQEAIQEVVLSLMTDSESIVKRSLVASLPELCLFFGRQKANDILLSHMITFLNDRDWQLRWYRECMAGSDKLVAHSLTPSLGSQPLLVARAWSTIFYH